MAKKAKNDAGDDLDTGFNPKYMKQIADWAETAEAMGEDELKKTIVNCQKSISDVEKDMEADEHLKALKDEIKDIQGAFKDAQKRDTAKTMFCIHLLKNRGNI